MTQYEMVLDYLENNPSMTRWDAFELGITELNTRICELRRDGYEIVGKMESTVNRYGKKVSYMRYSLCQ